MTDPIACTLTSAELRCRADELLPGLARRAAIHTVLADGWRLEFVPTPEMLTQIIDVVARERVCCAFLRFELLIPSGDAHVVLTIDGPPGTGAFLAGLPNAPAAAASPIEQSHPSGARTYGLTHLNLAVRDLDRAVGFYTQAFGAREYARVDGVAHLQGPGSHVILSLDGTASDAGTSGGIAHFGFRLCDPFDIDAAVDAVIAAGGRLRRRGEFAPNVPYAYVSDPDGYEIELWYE